MEHGVNRNLLVKWRRALHTGEHDPVGLLPVTVEAPAPQIQRPTATVAPTLVIGAAGMGEIDNLPVERALRGVAIGRRNYLFAGADSGGERAAAIYSLIGAKMNKVDPEAYLRFVLARIADHAINPVDQFMP